MIITADNSDVEKAMVEKKVASVKDLVGCFPGANYIFEEKDSPDSLKIYVDGYVVAGHNFAKCVKGETSVL